MINGIKQVKEIVYRQNLIKIETSETIKIELQKEITELQSLLDNKFPEGKREAVFHQLFINCIIDNKNNLEVIKALLPETKGIACKADILEAAMKFIQSKINGRPKPAQKAKSKDPIVSIKHSYSKQEIVEFQQLTNTLKNCKETMEKIHKNRMHAGSEETATLSLKLIPKVINECAEAIKDILSEDKHSNDVTDASIVNDAKHALITIFTARELIDMLKASEILKLIALFEKVQTEENYNNHKSIFDDISSFDDFKGVKQIMIPTLKQSLTELKSLGNQQTFDLFAPFVIRQKMTEAIRYNIREEENQSMGYGALRDLSIKDIQSLLNLEDKTSYIETIATAERFLTSSN